jgi:hypothetical protein
MTKCVNLADIDLNLSCAEQDNMGGIAPVVIFGYADEVGTWPDFPAATGNTAIDMEAAGALDGDVVMATGCRAYKFEFTDDVGSFTIAPQGENGGESFLYTLSIINAKIRKKILGFVNAVKGKKIFFIVQDNNGVYYLMGDAKRGARLANDSEGFVTGTNPTERNQASLNFTYSCPRALCYEGDVTNLLTASE